jgi:ABC-2 type transport system permease protein
MNFLWPVFLVFFGLTGADSGGAGPALAFSGLYGQAGFHAVLAGAGMLVTALNAIASSAVSREGKHLAFAKALPLSPGRQLLVKAGAAAVMGGVGCAVLAATALTVFRMPAVHLPALALLAPLGIAYAALSGVLLDVHFPKLHWDNAYKAVKQNVNVPLHMAFCALTAAGAFWLARRVPGPPVRALQVLASLLLLLDAVLFRLVKTAGARALEKIEV